MKLRINGEEREIELDTPRLDMLLPTVGIDTSRGVAVAVNDHVVPRGQWSEFVLQDGDTVEIIRATQGG